MIEFWGFALMIYVLFFSLLLFVLFCFVFLFIFVCYFCKLVFCIFVGNPRAQRNTSPEPSGFVGPSEPYGSVAGMHLRSADI